MDERILKWLHDIYMAIDEIDSFFVENEKRIESYKSNIILKRAIERNLEIIGEATNRIYKEDSSINIENSKSIIGLRNFIIHSYDNITDETIWAIIINHLPKLKTNVASLLDENKDSKG